MVVGACQPSPGRLWQESHEFEASLGYVVKPHLKHTKKSKQNHREIYHKLRILISRDHNGVRSLDPEQVQCLLRAYWDWDSMLLHCVIRMTSSAPGCVPLMLSQVCL